MSGDGTRGRGSDGEERTGWDRAWGDRRVKTIVGPLKIKTDPALGRVVSAIIAADPAEYADLVPRLVDECPICGEPTKGTPRLASSLHPTYKSGFKHGQGVWAHVTCFANCPDSDEPAPIPW
jgi:hypothetical protein